MDNFNTTQDREGLWELGSLSQGFGRCTKFLESEKLQRMWIIILLNISIDWNHSGKIGKLLRCDLIKVISVSGCTD